MCAFAVAGCALFTHNYTIRQALSTLLNVGLFQHTQVSLFEVNHRHHGEQFKSSSCFRPPDGGREHHDDHDGDVTGPLQNSVVWPLCAEA